MSLSSSHTNTRYVIQQELKGIDSDKVKEMLGELKDSKHFFEKYRESFRNV